MSNPTLPKYDLQELVDTMLMLARESQNHFLARIRILKLLLGGNPVSPFFTKAVRSSSPPIL
jgi:hypothetical protein